MADEHTTLTDEEIVTTGQASETSPSMVADTDADDADTADTDDTDADTDDTDA
jgi:hypothetical protein